MKLTQNAGRPVVAFALAGALALALSACGTSGSSGSSDSASAWSLSGQEPTIQGSFDEWNKANPDEKVKVEFFQNDAFKTKIRTAIGSGDAPTLVWSWGGGPLKAYADAGKLTPLDDSLTKDIFPAIADNGRVDGKLYAVPNTTVQPVLLYFNTEVLESAGIDAQPETWDELLDDVATLRAEGINPISLGGASKWPQLMWLEYLTDRIGGPEVFNAIQNNEADAWSDPAVLEALSMIQDLVKAGGFADGWESTTTDNRADTALVYSGKAAMILQGAWVYADFLTAVPDKLKSGGITWGSFPSVDGGVGDASAVVGNASNYWSVSSDATDAQQTAAKSYLAGGNMNEAYIDGLIAGGGVPPVVGLEDKLAAVENGNFLVDVYTMSRDASSFTLSWDQAIDPAAASDLLTNLDKIFLGQITPEQFATAMNATIK